MDTQDMSDVVDEQVKILEDMKISDDISPASSSTDVVDPSELRYGVILFSGFPDEWKGTYQMTNGDLAEAVKKPSGSILFQVTNITKEKAERIMTICKTEPRTGQILLACVASQLEMSTMSTKMMYVFTFEGEPVEMGGIIAPTPYEADFKIENISQMRRFQLLVLLRKLFQLVRRHVWHNQDYYMIGLTGHTRVTLTLYASTESCFASIKNITREVLENAKISFTDPDKES